MSYWSGKNVMVTGGGGFLGSHVVARLRLLDCKGITVVRSRDFDLTCESEVRQLFEQEPPDVLLHLAGHVGGIGANKARPADFYYKNILMNTFTIEYARIVGVEKIVAAGAGCGYPELSPLPLAESSYWEGFPQQESAPTRWPNACCTSNRLPTGTSTNYRSSSQSQATFMVRTTTSTSRILTSYPLWFANSSRPSWKPRKGSKFGDPGRPRVILFTPETWQRGSSRRLKSTIGRGFSTWPRGERRAFAKLLIRFES